MNQPPPFLVVAPKLEKHPKTVVPSLITPKPKSDKALALAVTLTLAFLIAIGLPVAAILPEKYIDKLPLNIIVPLYIDPNSGAWDRIYQCALERPDINFTIIINPNSGPGAPPFPGPNFAKAVEQLNLMSNIKTIGYVDTARGDRANTVLITEIETYAGWSQKGGLAIDGIFFDRTPTHASPEMAAYMKNISATVKHSDGFMGPRLVAQSPGRLPDTDLMNAYIDLTIVFEGGYRHVPSHEQLKADLASFPGVREDYGVLVHSFPKELGRVGLRRLINGLKKDVQYIFLTERSDEVYNAFGKIWDIVLNLLY